MYTTPHTLSKISLNEDEDVFKLSQGRDIVLEKDKELFGKEWLDYTFFLSSVRKPRRKIVFYN